MATAQNHSPTLDQRQRRVLLDTCRREVPIAAILFAAIIVFFDVLTLASGTELSTAYLLSDVVQGLGFLVVAWLVWRRIGPEALIPWLWVSAVVLNGAATSYQFTESPGGPSFGVLVLAAAVYGSLALRWAPFITSAVVLTIITSTAFVIGSSDEAAAWIITYLTALGASAALLFARRRSSLDVAEMAEELARAATRDPLTGLLNRHGLDEALPLLLSAADRAERPVHAIFIDVAALGEVNNRHGHHTGDLVLQRTADAMHRTSRTGDLLVRWGGDEFLILGIGERPDVEDFETRLCHDLDMTDLVDCWEGRLHVGLAVDHLEGVDELIRRADEHMYARRTNT